MKRIWFAWAVVIGATFVTACFAEGDVDPADRDDDSSDGSSGQGMSTTVATGSSPTSEATTDASASSESTDPSATTTETSSEPSSSSGDETGPAPAFCASVEAELGEPLIACTSFDPNDADLGTWTPSTDMGGQVDIIDEPTAPSSPRALRVSFEGAGGEAPTAQLVYEGSDSLLLTRLRFRMELGGCDGPTPLAQLHFGGEEPFTVTLSATGKTLELTIVDAMHVATTSTLDAEQLGAAGPWSEWELRVDVDSAYVDVLLNGEFIAQLTDLATPSGVPAPPTVRLGIARKREGYECLALFDDVVVY
ncbi:MAG: hypothetical protein IAG13_04665 [Deltaproteobacteria bacterium]|nr:hypothetical protein [Nannocystaceae bacterium]